MLSTPDISGVCSENRWCIGAERHGNFFGVRLKTHFWRTSLKTYYLGGRINLKNLENLEK